MLNSEKLLKLIDDRIRKYIYSSGVLKQESATVEGIPSSGYASVQLSSGGPQITIPVRTGLTVVSGDFVMVYYPINDLNNAIVFEKFKGK